MAKKDLNFISNANEIIVFEPDDECTRTASKYNYRIQCRVNDDDAVLAEIDSDSHISLITEKYFKQLRKKKIFVEILNEKPMSFRGLGSQLSSKYPPIILKLQIGRVILSGRFVVTDHLTSSNILLGTDFLTKNKVSVAPFQAGWYCTIGPIDKPLGKVSAFITSKITLNTENEEIFEPFEEDYQLLFEN